MIKAEITELGSQIIARYPEQNLSFIISRFKGRQCTRLAAKLTKYTTSMFGGLIQGLMGEVEGEDEEQKLEAISLIMGGVLEGAFDQIDNDDFLNFFFELFTCVTKDNKPIDYDEEFTGENLVVAFDLAKNVLMHNFKPVFQQLGIAALFKPKAVEE